MHGYPQFLGPSRNAQNVCTIAIAGTVLNITNVVALIVLLDLGCGLWCNGPFILIQTISLGDLTFRTTNILCGKINLYVLFSS